MDRKVLVEMVAGEFPVELRAQVGGDDQVRAGDGHGPHQPVPDLGREVDEPVFVSVESAESGFTRDRAQAAVETV
ncbi:MAG TPA: hypothetical protein VFA96_04700 [Nocardioides sp.]|nr:hypothetical protein [Nocardioides sp.]